MLTTRQCMARYGVSATDVSARLVTIPWCGKRPRVHRKEAERFKRVARKIRMHERWHNLRHPWHRIPTWVPKDVQTFNWRHMMNDPSKPLSKHSWGIAMDIDPAHNPVQRHDSTIMCDIPGYVFAAFRAEGFSCGIDWRGGMVDPMHAEIAV